MNSDSQESVDYQAKGVGLHAEAAKTSKSGSQWMKPSTWRCFVWLISASLSGSLFTVGAIYRVE